MDTNSNGIAHNSRSSKVL